MRLNLRESALYQLTRWLLSYDRRARDFEHYQPDEVRRVLLVSSSALGDTVLSTAAMAAMRSRFPRAHISALIHRDYLPLFTSSPDLDEVIPFHGGYRHFLRTVLRLRRNAPDLALVLHGNEPQATATCYLAGARFIFKLPNTSRFAFLLSNREPRLGWGDLGHGLNGRLRTAALAGAKVSGARMHLAIPEQTSRHTVDALAEHGIGAEDLVIGFQVGASSRGRQWPVGHFAELGTRLHERWHGVRFLLFGAPSEVADMRALSRALTVSNVILSTDLGDIELLPALLRRCELLVTGDTGSLHVAVAVGTPTVSLFAVSDPATSGPAQDPERHLVVFHPRSPDVSSKTDDPSHMARIGVDEVYAAVVRQLESRYD